MIIAIFIISMLVGIIIGLPIAVALLLCAVATALALGGGDANPTIIARTLMQGSASLRSAISLSDVCAADWAMLRSSHV